jgi:hypothetical protein
MFVDNNDYGQPRNMSTMRHDGRHGRVATTAAFASDLGCAQARPNHAVGQHLPAICPFSRLTSSQVT